MINNDALDARWVGCPHRAVPGTDCAFATRFRLRSGWPPCLAAVENIDEQIAELEARLAGSSVNLSGGGLAGEERQRVERQLSALQRSRRCVLGACSKIRGCSMSGSGWGRAGARFCSEFAGAQVRPVNFVAK